ncbi:SAM-dependent methyltransferase [Pseudogemmobacter humi]|nr:class I SAM-dependent methyltransferase [Pseudogemmobacter humi]
MDWDKAFSGVDYRYGTEPAAFLPRVADLIPEGARVMFLADGEGRNSVWLAAQGRHRVSAMEQSAPALEKARRLAGMRGAAVDFRQSAIEDQDWSEPFDAILGLFIQFAPPALMRRIHAGIARSVVPGGLVLLHGYHPDQLAYGTGGPDRADQMYTPEGLTADFPGWEILLLERYDAGQSAGSAHQGRSALIDFVARRPGQG